MTELDSLEDRVAEIFLHTLPIKHSYYNTKTKKINLFAEFYIYIHFYTKIALNKNGVEFLNLNKKLNKILTNIPNTSEDIDFIKEVLTSLRNLTENGSIRITDKVATEYRTKSTSIVRKLKIKSLLGFEK